jgi:hypothetical protein
MYVYNMYIYICGKTNALRVEPRCSVTLTSTLAQQPDVGQARPIPEISISHTITHPQPVRLLWTSDRPVAETST